MGQQRGKAKRVPQFRSGPDGEPVVLTDAQRVKLTERAMNIALWHLGESAKTEQQIRRTLVRKDIPDDIINATIQRLGELRYLDDKSFAENFTRSRSEFRKQGPRAIRAALRTKGVAPDIAEDAVAAISDDQQHEQARLLVARKLRSTSGLEPRVRVQRLAAFLARRGYAPGLCFQVVREVLAEADDADAVDAMDESSAIGD